MRRRSQHVDHAPPSGARQLPPKRAADRRPSDHQQHKQQPHLRYSTRCSIAVTTAGARREDVVVVKVGGAERARLEKHACVRQFSQKSVTSSRRPFVPTADSSVQ